MAEADEYAALGVEVGDGGNHGPAPATGLQPPEATAAPDGDARLGESIPPSYAVWSSEYQQAARRAVADALIAQRSHDPQAMARAQQELSANPPDNISPNNGPQMKSWDPTADEAARMRAQNDIGIAFLGLFGAPAGLVALHGGTPQQVQAGLELGWNELGAAGSAAEAARLAPSKWPAPSGWRLPSSNGYWSGTRGDSLWHSAVPEVDQRSGGRGIRFNSGYIDLSPYTVEQYSFEGLKGTRADSGLADAKLARDWGFENAAAVAAWRDKNNLLWHHVEDGATLQLVPKDLNERTPHIGGASKQRGGR
jgi:hypothetical protein